MTPAFKKQLYGILSIFVLLLISFTLFRTTAEAQQNPPTGTEPPAGRSPTLYLPLIAGGSSGGQRNPGVDQAFTSFHHPPMGLTLSYPADWALDTLDTSPPAPTPEYLPPGYDPKSDEEGTLTFGNRIILSSPHVKEHPQDTILIGINSVRISPNGDLATIVALQSELERIDSPLGESVPTTITKQTMEGIDDIIVVSAKSQYGQSEAIWLAKDGLTFVVATASTDPAFIAMMHQIFATFQFDGTTPELAKKYEKYTVDADALRIALERWKTQTEPSPTGQPPTSTVQSSAINVSGNQKALSANWPAPVIPINQSSTWNVQCGSDKHTGNAEFALDIGASLNTDVYAVADGTVSFTAIWDGSSTGSYGTHVIVDTTLNIASQTRTYSHAYAHLNSIEPGIVVGHSVIKGDKIGKVGSTGAGGAVHLHFHVRDSNQNPVDPTPILGFIPKVNFPTIIKTSCGVVDYAEKDPIVIESVATTQRLHQGSNGKSWNCINPPGATVECYMYGDPNTGGFFVPLNTSVAPQLVYANVFVYQNPVLADYYLWTCGHASSGGDDSIYVQNSSLVPMIAQASPWTWVSANFPSGLPTLTLTSGALTLNVWMREDGARFGRILLARSSSYNPNGNIKCGPY
ncbi:MAG: M23 family metallopeptidase [Chloroflexi bacterium]|nr:M23 family metallopeptidase [Chloroflexota bacterium]